MICGAFLRKQVVDCLCRSVSTDAAARQTARTEGGTCCVISNWQPSLTSWPAQNPLKCCCCVTRKTLDGVQTKARRVRKEGEISKMQLTTIKSIIQARETWMD